MFLQVGAKFDGPIVLVAGIGYHGACQQASHCRNAAFIGYGILVGISICWIGRQSRPDIGGRETRLLVTPRAYLA